MRKLSLILVSMFSLMQCTLTDSDEDKFIFIGHSYDWRSVAGDKVDSRLELLDYSKYNGVWLGGDMCGNTSLNPRTFEYLDSLFDLKNPNTHFALGNHDYRDYNLEAYFAATGRPDYYTSSFKNIAISVINTNLNSSDCENLNAQYKMLSTVTDTLSMASHYVILGHHEFFYGVPGLEEFESNGPLYNYPMNCDRFDSYFRNTIYPKLVTLEKKGIEVIVVMGDIGWRKGCEMRCKNGINFVASGINNSYYIGKGRDVKELHDDLVLIFKYKEKNEELTWKYTSLNELTNTDKALWLAPRTN